jgi:hypothetical protein
MEIFAVKQIVETEQFIERCSGDTTSTLVFMGDLIDRGKSVEVIEAILELKRKYPKMLLL